MDFTNYHIDIFIILIKLFYIFDTDIKTTKYISKIQYIGNIKN